MATLSNLNAVFGHFQNLNLLALLHNLREGRTARQAWLSGSSLCPIAHGMPQGEQVMELQALAEMADLSAGCGFAAFHLGTEPEAVVQFIRLWDGNLSRGSLLHILEEIWEERLTDAEALQDLLQAGERNHCHGRACILDDARTFSATTSR